jgi:hypothetical protein
MNVTTTQLMTYTLLFYPVFKLNKKMESYDVTYVYVFPRKMTDLCKFLQPGGGEEGGGALRRHLR